MSAARRAALVAGLLALLPRAAFACAVCFDPRAENRVAFLATTAFLSFLPLGLVAGLVSWLRHRAGMPEDGERTNASGER